MLGVRSKRCSIGEETSSFPIPVIFSSTWCARALFISQLVKLELKLDKNNGF